MDRSTYLAEQSGLLYRLRTVQTLLIHDIEM